MPPEALVTLDTVELVLDDEELVVVVEPPLGARPVPEGVPELDPDPDPEGFDPCGSEFTATELAIEPLATLGPSAGG
jgi:hypothetical protein